MGRLARASAVVPVAVGVAALAALLAATGTAAAFGPTPIFGFATSQGFALLSSQGILSTTAVSPGDLVFGDTVYVQFLDIGPNRTVFLSVTQSGGGSTLYQNATFSVASKNVTEFDVNLASSTSVKVTKLCVDGGCESFLHQTPVTLLPSGVLNIGGLDLLLFGIAVEFFVLVVPLTAIAAGCQRRALWAPKGTLTVLLGLPHVVFAVVIVAVADYQLFDEAFGGGEFIAFPVLFAFFFFVWVLHLFNRAEPALVLRPDPQGGHRLRFNAWALWVGETEDGRRVLVGTRWRDWLSRLLGHYTVLVPANADGTKVGGPAESRLTHYYADTVGEKEAKFRVRPGRESPLDDFVVAGEVDKGVSLKGHLRPRFLYWVDSDGWLDGAQPRLSFHREVKTPPVLDGEGRVVEPAGTKRKLSLPHYVDPPAGMRLAGAHYYDTPVAALRWITAERAYRRVEDLRNQVGALRATSFVAADEMAEEQMGELLRLLERERRPLTDAEADEETRSGPPKARDVGPTTAEAQASERAGPVGTKKSRAGTA